MDLTTDNPGVEKALEDEKKKQEAKKKGDGRMGPKDRTDEPEDVTEFIKAVKFETEVEIEE